MADFPSSTKTFPTLVDHVDSALAAHQNERGAEITALETYLIEAATEVTVSGGVLTVTKSRHTVQPESGTDDNIDTITGIPDNGELILTVSDLGTDTIVFKHGTGNLSLPASVDITLTTGAVKFYRKGSTVYAEGSGGDWTQIAESWSYASASTITIPSGGTSRFSSGVKIRFKQGGGWKYYVGRTIADTLITVLVSTDYTVANSAITDIAISYADRPSGFPEWLNRTPTLSASGSMTISASTLSYAKFRVSGTTIKEQGAYTAITLGGSASTDLRVSTVADSKHDRVAFVTSVADNGGFQEIGVGLIIQDAGGDYLRCRRNLSANYTAAAGAQCYYSAEYEME